MKEDMFSLWCQEATEQIRYKPDRKMVYQELMDHLEDHRFALMDQQDMDPEEAAQKALEAMGSAAEIAPQLARIHRPFWGYVYSIARATAILLCSFAVLIMSVGLFSTVNYFLSYRTDPRYLHPGGLGWETVLHIQPDAMDYADGYIFQIPNAVLWQRGDAMELHFTLRTIDCRLMQRNASLVNEFWALDSRGNYYGSRAEMEYTDFPRVTHSSAMGTGCIASSHLLIRDIPAGDIQWIELHYDRDGRDIVLRIHLTGGEGQ